DLRANVTGLPEALAPQTLSLAAGEATIAGWDVTVPSDAASLAWDVEVAEHGGAADHVRVTQQVAPAVPVTPLAATLLQWAPGGARGPVRRRGDALAGRGGIAVSLAPSLAAGLDGVRDWMRRYPFTCLEQRVSRAVALGDEATWREVTSCLPGFPRRGHLLQL